MNATIEQFLQYLSAYTNALAANAFRWYFVLTTILTILILYFIKRRKDGDKSNHSLLSFIFSKNVYLHPSAITGYKFFLIDPIIKRILFSPALEIPISLFTFVQVQKLLVTFASPVRFDFGFLESHPIIFIIGFTVMTAMIRDFGYYLQHNLMHRIPFLWEFHKVHHSAKVLTPLTDWQNHPVDLLTMPYFIGIFTGVIQALLDYGLTSELGVASIFGFNVINFAYYSIGYHLRHMPIWFSFGWYINHIFMSPAQHHIHHSIDSKHFNKNFGSAFSFWDWVFGTLYNPKKQEPLTFGLPDQEDQEYSSLWKLYTLPFTKNVSAGRLIPVIILVGVIIYFVIVSWVEMFSS